MEWAAFERVSGPLLLGERLDVGFALVSLVTAAAHGVKIEGRAPRFKDFLFDWDGQPPSEEQAAALLGMALEAAVSRPSPHSSSTS
jgi:hypothetical protein